MVMVGAHYLFDGLVTISEEPLTSIPSLGYHVGVWCVKCVVCEVCGVSQHKWETLTDL